MPRGFLVAYVSVTMIMLWFAPGSRIVQFCRLLLIVTLAFLVVLGVWTAVEYFGGEPTSFDHLSRASSSGRTTQLWPVALEQALSHPFFGIGARTAYQDLKIAAHPHNFTLQIAMEYGLVFLLLVVSFIILTICRMHRFIAKAFREKSLAMAYFCAILCVAIYSQFSGVLVMPASQITAALVIGVSVSEYLKSSKVDVAGSGLAQISVRSKVTSILKYFAIVLSLLASMIILIEYSFLADLEKLDRYNSYNSPRVWAHDA